MREARAWAGPQESDRKEAWSTTDFPYQCLVDARRTTAFQAAIASVVKPGHVVVDAGAGSGILSFFAAQAGAARVYAVEMEPHLASCLARSIRANGLGDVVELVSGDVRVARLPRDVDVLICEMIDTGLMDEMQVVALNALRDRGVITQRTRSIPFRYETFVELGSSDFRYYGFTVLAPRHDWPHYRRETDGWLPAAFQAFSAPHRVAVVDLQQPVACAVDAMLTVATAAGGRLNAVRVSGRADLAEGITLGATGALNGDKVVPVAETRVTAGQIVRARIRYRMGCGLDTFQARFSM